MQVMESDHPENLQNNRDSSLLGKRIPSSTSMPGFLREIQTTFVGRPFMENCPFHPYTLLHFQNYKYLLPILFR